MFVTISDFMKEWNKETDLTQKILNGLTDDSNIPFIIVDKSRFLCVKQD